MAATYSQLGQIAQQPDFVNRVQIAMMKAAISIYNEGAGVTGHTARAAYAVKVLGGSYALLQAVQSVLTSTTIIGEAQESVAGNAIPDADIDTQIAAMWNALAGA